ncbi:ankyrin unc44 [Colletotrichum chrysophilum]|uniref:Ankyrin unc44 n=1 Tax=Colletotrichum chrysophilum TaxID=1836956 RepID=A0AAD9EQD5_9PEZI|nr:ankyrin unc44 [Colletotrichum chrysophilum]
MEALGAAAAIAQFVELSFKTGKLAHSVVSSFQHAPAEITKLRLKLQSLHDLLLQVAALCDELPETQAQLTLLPEHHMRMFAMGMESISDSLMRLEGIITVSAGASHGVRNRLRWAMLDKRKAQSILQDAQMVNDELSIMLQILMFSWDWDLQEVHYLLETGQANIHDADEEIGGLLEANQLDLVLFALEIANIDPDHEGAIGRTPMSNAARTGWIEGIAALRQYGACVNVSEGSWNGTPLFRSMQDVQVLSDTSHYLLLQGTDPGLKSFDGLSHCGEMMTKKYSPITGWYLQFPYIAFEGSVAHLLHHGSDPFEVFGTDPSIPDDTWANQPPWSGLMGHIQASDVARFWTYGLSRSKDTYLLDAHKDARDAVEEFAEQVEIMDRHRCFNWTFQYNIQGDVTWNSKSSTSSEVSGEAEGSPVAVFASFFREGQAEGFSQDVCHEDKVSEYDRDTRYLAGGDFVPIWEHTDQQIRGRENPNLDLSPEFFKNATRFHHHTAILQGRRQLSRWPMVRALCDGLQHAAYRVEMDDDGDLWYDCDDGDRYFDAWETQPAEDRDDWLVDACPICQNFDEYGLGRVLDIEYEAIEKVQEYRRQVQEGKRRYFWQ